MRAVSLVWQPGAGASADAKIDWLMKVVQSLALASRQEGSTLADPYTITPPAPPVRTLDATASPTAQDVANVLATFLSDMQKRGLNAKFGGSQ